MFVRIYHFKRSNNNDSIRNRSRDRQTWSRIGHKVAVPVIDHKDPFYPRYSVYKLMLMEEHDLNYLRPNNTNRDTLKWGAELPPSIKKYHNKFWKSKMLVLK